MLHLLLLPFASEFQIFTVLRYITFRSAMAVFTAMILCFVFGPMVIRWLRSKQKEGQPIRTDGPASHLETKVGTPTMGGSLILGSLLISIVLWGDLTNPYVWIVMMVMIGFGSVGAVDDYMKLRYRSTNGLSARIRIFCQILISSSASYALVILSPEAMQSHLSIPFLKDLFLNLGWFFIPFSVCVMIGTSNAVNLTDGLDGLAIGPVMITAGCFAIIAYSVGNTIFSEYLQIPYIQGVGELAVVCGAIIGAGLGFLWFNAPPAKVFMGDTGSLSLGAAFGAMAVATKHELVLLIIGGLFVMETISVILQVLSFKLTGRRIFLMAPIHHHFEKKGWSESTIVMRFWIISIGFALLGMTTLKLR